MRGRAAIGDGDDCPVVPAHGAMFAVPGTQRQYCPDQTHDGIWSKAGHEAPTRSRWPLGHLSFAAAVDKWRSVSSPQGEAASTALPALDLDLGEL